MDGLSAQHPVGGTAAPHPEQGHPQPRPERAAILAAIDEYTARGWAVFPLLPGDKDPATTHGFYDAENDPQAARALFAKYKRKHVNIAVATGTMSGGLLVVDTDIQHGKDGEARLAALEAQHGALPATYRVRSGSGGKHRYFAVPAGVRIASRKNSLAEGVDVKCEKGYVVAPPSITTYPPRPPEDITGPYTVECDLPVAHAPAWLLDLLAARTSNSARMNGHANGATVDNSDLSAGVVHDWSCTLENDELLTDILAHVEVPDPFDSDHDAHDNLTRLGWLGGVTALKQFYMQHGWPLDVMYRHVDAYSSRAPQYAEAVKNGVARAKFDEVTPNGTLDIGAIINSAKHCGWKWPKTDTGLAAAAPEIVSANAADVQLADAFARKFSGKLLYEPAACRWFMWNQTIGVWVPCAAGQEVEHAKALARELLDVAYALPQDTSAGKAMRTIARRANSESGVRAMIALAASDPGLQLPPGASFDSDPWLLGVQNGVADLRNGNLLAPDPAYYITKRAGAAYLGAQSDPSRDCPRFLRFVTDIFVDESGQTDWGLVQFMVRWMGYALTGTTGEQYLIFLHGMGENGKSKLADVLLAVLGDYGIRANTALVTQQPRNNSPRADMVRLDGARFVSVDETGESQPLDEQIVKALIGSETIAVRGLYQAEREIRLTAKFMVTGNHRPTVRGTDDGIWRRIKLVPMRRVFNDAHRDPDLLDRLLAERDRIITLLVRAAVGYRVEGQLVVPDCVRHASEAYRAESDIFGQWLAERTERARERSVEFGLLLSDYQNWARECGSRPLGLKRFRERLTGAGLTVGSATTSNRRSTVYGLMLIPG